MLASPPCRSISLILTINFNRQSRSLSFTLATVLPSLNSQALANHPADTPKSTQFKKEPRQFFAYLLSRSCLFVRSVNFFSFSFRSVMGLAFCTDIFSPLRNLVYRKYPLTLHDVTRAAASFDKAPVVYRGFFLSITIALSSCTPPARARPACRRSR